MASSLNSMNSDIVLRTPSKLSEKQDYIFHGGRRHVRPYYFEFISHVNKRWVGKTVVDLFADEFKALPREYYVDAVKCGRIKVGGETVPVSYIVRSSQRLTHYLHRHEPPVMTDDVVILQKEPDVVTVCKPASVPVHPCGQYRKNTVVGILDAEHDLGPLFPIHRLDRLVSGLLILARNAAKADFFRQQIQGGMVKKLYIAKVIGVFPENELHDFDHCQQVVDANIDYDGSEGRSTSEDISSSGGDKKVNGKPSCTKFTRIDSNGTHSLVLCEPVTGRTHQIRVHLQYTGHPIANDPLYLTPQVDNLTTLIAKRIDAGEKKMVSPNDYVYSSEDFSIDPMCPNCPKLIPKGYEELEEALWLHCVRYSGSGWAYECPYPSWASL